MIGRLFIKLVQQFLCRLAENMSCLLVRDMQDLVDLVISNASVNQESLNRLKMNLMKIY